MATIAELKVKIGANVTDFDKKLSGIQNKMKETGKRMQSMGKTMSMAVTAPLAGMAAMALKSFDTQVKAENKLRAALIANGQEVEATMKDYKKFASELQAVSTVGDESTLQLLQVAQSMGVTGEGAKTAAMEAIALGKAMGMSEQSAIRYTAALADGDANMLTRYLPALKGIKDESAKVAKAHELLGKMMGAVTAEAEDGLGPLIQLQNQFGDLMEEFGGIIAQGIKPLIDKLKEGVAWFQNLSAGTKKNIVMIAGLAAAVGPLLVVLGFLISTILPALMTGLAALTGPIALVVAAVAGAAYLIYKHWDDLVAYFTTGGGSAMWDEVVDTWSKGVEMIKTLISQTTAGIIYIWETYNAEIIAVFNMAIGYLTKVWSMIFRVIKNYLSIIGDLFDFWAAIFKGDWETVWNEAKSILFKVLKTMIDVLTTGLDIILAGVGKVVSLFNEDWANAINDARDGITEFSNKLVEGAAAWLGYEEAVKKATEAEEEFNETVEEVKPDAPSLPTPPGGGAGAGAGVPSGDDSMMMMLEQIDKWQEPMNNLREAFKKANAEAKIFGTTAGDVLTAKIGMTKNAISEAIDKFGEEHQVVKGLVEELKKLEDAQGNVGISADQMVAKISNTLSMIASAVGQIAGQVTSIIGQNFEARKIALDNYYGAEKERIDSAGMSEEAHANAMELLDERVAKKKAQMAKKKAKTDKKAALVGAMVNTAAAVASALTLPPPANIIMAGIVGALGAAQIAAISATPIPSFAQGGIIGAPMIAQIGDAPSGPEVVAPLSKLQSMLGGGMELKTVIRGEDIILVTDRTKSNRGFIT